MAHKGKRYVKALEAYDRERFYLPGEAIDLARSLATAHFDETVELSLRLGVDPRKADQQVRGSVSLPRGTGKSVRVAVFAQGDKAREALEAGAEEVGARTSPTGSRRAGPRGARTSEAPTAPRPRPR